MSVISESEAARYDLLMSRASLSNEAQAVAAASLQEAIRMNASKDEIAELQQALQNHLHNVETFATFRQELEDRVAGVERVPEQLAQVAGEMAVHEYDRRKPATSDQKGPYSRMATAIQARRNQRSVRGGETMTAKMERMRRERG